MNIHKILLNTLTTHKHGTTSMCLVVKVSIYKAFPSVSTQTFLLFSFSFGSTVYGEHIFFLLMNICNYVLKFLHNRIMMECPLFLWFLHAGVIHIVFLLHRKQVKEFNNHSIWVIFIFDQCWVMKICQHFLVLN